MFAGHYAAALAAKAAEPKAPMWTLVAAAQLVDIGWAALVMAGIERGRIDPTLPGSSFVLEHMPWTHSLPAAIACALAATLLSKTILRLSTGAAIAIGAVVFSHWLLALISNSIPKVRSWASHSGTCQSPNRRWRSACWPSQACSGRRSAPARD